MKSIEDEEKFHKAVKQRASILKHKMYSLYPDKCNTSQIATQFHNLQSSPVLLKNKYLCHSNYSEPINNITGLQNINNIDCCTQTSKTIIELATLEMGQLTPDSLNQSPRGPDMLINGNLNAQQLKSTLNNFENFEKFHENSMRINYVQKNQLCQDSHNCTSIKNAHLENKSIVYINKSLTETFLERKKPFVDNNHSLKAFQPSINLHNSMEQLQNNHINNFKSRSFSESSDYSKFSKMDDHQRPYQVSRFTIRKDKSSNNQQPKDLKTANVSQNSVSHNGSYKVICNQLGWSNKNKRSNSFMLPTISSEQKNQQHKVQGIKYLISPKRRGKSLSPFRNTNFTLENCKSKIPYIDESRSHLNYNNMLDKKKINVNTCKETLITSNTKSKCKSPILTATELLKDDIKIPALTLSQETVCVNRHRSVTSSISSSPSENLTSALNHIRDSDWSISLKGFSEITELCQIMNVDLLYPHMTYVNQRLLELLRSPRSHVCRTSCQVAGCLFEFLKDTRRPEFDDIVEILLNKTADSNKFIRQDANLSLDCMVTHIPIFHAIRSLCLKGPTHKNPLARTATIRLIVCAVVIVGAGDILNLPNHEHTRKRIIQHLPKFMSDKYIETRKYGERLYKILSNEAIFEPCIKKYLEKDNAVKMKALFKYKDRKIKL